MTEIILPPEEEQEETPQAPELNIDKPTENSKVITIEFEAKKTKKVSTKDTNQQLYTTDTDAWFEFKETSLEGANGTYSAVFRNRHDGSIFQRTGDVVSGVAYYKIPEQEIRHAGKWRGQLVYTLENGNTTAREFGYDVKGHILDGKDVREIVVEDFETLMSQLRSMKDNAEQELAGLVNTAEQNETDRQAFFDDLVEDIDELQTNYQELLDTGVLQTNINQKLAEAEQEYAPRLTDLEQNKADKDELSELQAYVGYTDHDIVGIEADLQNRRVTRIAGAVNRTAGALFDDIRAFGGRRRCTVADDGEVLGYYGESSYDETGETGQVMVEQPKFYYKVVPLKMDKIEDGKGFHLRKARYYVSDYPKEGFKVHPAFVDENGKIRPHIYLSAFEGSIYDTSGEAYLKNDEQIADFNADMLSSIPGAKPASGLSQALSLTNLRKLANNRGLGWGLSYSASASLTQMLFAIEYASFNTQEELGYGVLGKPSGEGNESELTGATTSLGNGSGFVKNENDFEVPTYRGEENFYGNIYKWVDGLNYQGGEGRRNLYVATHGFADNTDAEPFQDIGFTLPGGVGYVSAFGYGNEDLDWLFFGSEYSGNSSVPVGDQNHSHFPGWRVARLGGSWLHSESAGGFCWDFNAPSGNSYRSVGSRLVYAPPVEEVA